MKKIGVENTAKKYSKYKINKKNIDIKAIWIYIYHGGLNEIENSCPHQFAFITSSENLDN
jgi:hypothetical protein